MPTNTTPQAEIPAFLTAGQVARLLRVRDAKVLSWLRSGQLRGADLSERPGRGKARWRISRDDLRAFLESRQPRPATPTPPRRRRKPEQRAGWIEFIR
ncbi:MAG: helix-turn-helix domain-containing protein [Pirellulaceae bacterium]|nr:helix-turn-helix domain-containing protein [Pirellulaceae bacterium]